MKKLQKTLKNLKTENNNYIKTKKLDQNIFQVPWQWENKTLDEACEYFCFDPVENGDIKLTELNGTHYNSLIEEYNVILLHRLSNLLFCAEWFHEIHDLTLSELTEREIEILLFMNGADNGKIHTVNEVATHYDISSVRVRQINAKALEKYRETLDKNWEYFASGNAQALKYLTNCELDAIVWDSREWIKDLLTNWNHNDFWGFYFFDLKLAKKIDKLEKKYSQLDKIINRDVFEQLLDAELEKIGVYVEINKVVNYIMENNKYVSTEEICYAEPIKLNEAVEYLFKYEFDGPLKYTEESSQMIIELLKEYFDLEVNNKNNFRSIQANMRNSEYVTLVDKSCYQYFDMKSVDQKFIYELDKYLNEHFNDENTTVIGVDKLFKKYRSECRSNKIISKMHLYSVIKYYLSEDFQVGKGNTLNIFKSKEHQSTREEILYNYIKDKGGKCSTDELVHFIGRKYQLTQAILESTRMLQWGDDEVILADELHFTDKEIAFFRDVVESEFSNCYTSVPRLLEDMQNSNVEAAKLLSAKGIDSYEKLRSILRMTYPEIKGRVLFLRLPGCKYSNIYEALSDELGEKTTREEIRQKLEYLAIRGALFELTYDNLTEPEYYVEYDFGLYMAPNAFDARKDQLAQVKKLAKKVIAKDGFICASKFDEYVNELPKSIFEYNQHMFSSLLKMTGFKQLNLVNRDYRYDLLVFTDQESKYTKLDDLIIDLILDKFTSRTSEEAILDYIVEAGVIRRPKNNKLPFVVRNDNRILNKIKASK